uniref:Uncharacterized protein n=1 Tax=Triticum urartu TaxID=4572 RepID=A0A8R7PZ75_TRIUA
MQAIQKVGRPYECSLRKGGCMSFRSDSIQSEDGDLKEE